MRRQQGLASNRSRFGLFTILLVFLFTVGCQSKRPPKPKAERNFKVSVSAGGAEIENFEQRLVHRVALTPQQLNILARRGPGTLNVPFGSIGEFDREGNSMGFRLVASRDPARYPNLGLRAGDVITAVGKRRASSVKDLWDVFNAVREDGTASVTLIRDGSPHKILYSIRE